MSIASEIIRLQTAKANIKSAIEDKGVDVPASATLDTYDEYISGITTGGGSSEAEKGLIDGSLSGGYEIPSGATSVRAYAFYGFISLSAVTIPSTVTTIGTSAFSGCTSLATVTIPNSVTSIAGNVFKNCRSLTSITIPSSVTSIGASAFYSCSGLTAMTIEAVVPPTLGGAGTSTALGQTTYTFPIYVPDASVSAYKTAYPDYASRIVSISEKLPSGYTRLSYLDNSAGTMQIDMLNLPFNVDGDTSIEIKFQLTGNDGVLYANLDGLIISNGYVVRGGTTEYGTLLSSGVDSVIAMDTAGDVTVNGTTVLQVADGENWFGANMATVFDIGYPEGYLYYIKIWNSGTLVANYIPAQNSSNVNGLYDGVNSTWYPDVNN